MLAADWNILQKRRMWLYVSSANFQIKKRWGKQWGWLFWELIGVIQITVSIQYAAAYTPIKLDQQASSSKWSQDRERRLIISFSKTVRTPKQGYCLHVPPWGCSRWGRPIFKAMKREIDHRAPAIGMKSFPPKHLLSNYMDIADTQAYI